MSTKLTHTCKKFTLLWSDIRYSNIYHLLSVVFWNVCWRKLYTKWSDIKFMQCRCEMGVDNRTCYSLCPIALIYGQKWHTQHVPSKMAYCTVLMEPLLCKDVPKVLHNRSHHEMYSIVLLKVGLAIILALISWRNNITYSIVNTLRPRRNEQHFADDIFKRIFFNENVIISTKISLKFVPKGPINNIPALVQIMAWRRSGD